MLELLSIWGYCNLAETFILYFMLIRIHSSGHVKNEIDSGLGYISRGGEGGGGREEGGEDDNFYQHIFPVEEF